MSVHLIGLTGLPGAGKDSVASLLRDRGFALYRFSDEIRVEAARRGVHHPSREQLQQLGDRLRDKSGPGVLGARLAERIIAARTDHAVTNGIRHLAEWHELQERLIGRGLLVAVIASPGVRFGRLLRRAREGDPRTREEFDAMDARDLGSSLPGTHLQVGAALESADITIENGSTPKALAAKVERLLSRSD